MDGLCKFCSSPSRSFVLIIECMLMSPSGSPYKVPWLDALFIFYWMNSTSFAMLLFSNKIFWICFNNSLLHQLSQDLHCNASPCVGYNSFGPFSIWTEIHTSNWQEKGREGRKGAECWTTTPDKWLMRGQQYQGTADKEVYPPPKVVVSSQV